jgi:hypothetical protein
VFWGGCVVFWCSFWVGFWLSESLRGVFTPARNGRLQGSPRVSEGNLKKEGNCELCPRNRYYLRLRRRSPTRPTSPTLNASKPAGSDTTLTVRM